MNTYLCHFETLDSTNILAVEFAKKGAPEGTVIVAKTQTNGHGRMNREWVSPLGGLWFSIILKPQVDPRNVAQVTLVTGIAIAKGLRKLYECDDITIKWPNDLLLSGKKVCGILSEMQLDVDGAIDYAIIGVGINVNVCKDNFPNELKNFASSLNSSTSKSYSNEEVLNVILREFIEFYEVWMSKGIDVLLPVWKQLNSTIGKAVSVKDNDKVIFSGVVSSIDERGAIVVVDNSGLKRTFDFGEISIR